MRAGGGVGPLQVEWRVPIDVGVVGLGPVVQQVVQHHQVAGLAAEVKGVVSLIVTHCHCHNRNHHHVTA